ncbi:PilT domain-containing protein [Oscillochloris trichoides DG-6]|uniref:PilT domain-containing protein n=1 Tax=Oscillochloris trichoides DG-6 TaxID=765420 RepID=E1IFI8_9CHLR|nr:PIN domain-containing protein [Oscillochloris trichoides]EFO80004.1 PilT domain-containing protein [Oscillochloris trichoides DG-6]
MMTEAEPKVLFIDTNILVYASWSVAPLHREAQHMLATYTSRGTILVISRQVLREFVATLYRPRTGLAITDITAEVRALEARYVVIEDGPTITAQLLALLEDGATQVHDTNIAATCIVAGIRHILTNNPADFAPFQRWLSVVPLVP